MANSYYLKPEDMKKLYDIRRLQQLLSDTGEQITAGAVDTDPLLIQGIHWATGQINTAIYQGKRYTKEDLQTIIDDANGSPGNSDYVAAYAVLQQLCADLTFGWIMSRRGYSPDVMERLAPRYKEALATLERLYLGERVFTVGTAIEAGVPKAARIGSSNLTPSAWNRLFGVWPDTPGFGWGGTDYRSRIW